MNAAAILILMVYYVCANDLSLSCFQIFQMDLWAPVKDSNDYGARTKKGVSGILQ